MQHGANQHASWFLFAVVFPILFLIGWFLIATIISYVSGWNSLTGQFRLQFPFIGDRWTWQSATMRWGANYNNCLTVGGNREGLYLAMNRLFAFRHPPILVPWMEIRFTRRRIWFADFVQFSLGRELGIPLLVRASLANKLKLAAGDHWPIEQI